MDSTATCPTHPDRPASGTCERCGRFLCDECGGSRLDVACDACLARAVLEVPSGATRAKVAYGFLIANGICQILTSLLVADVDETSTNIGLGIAILAVSALLVSTFLGSVISYSMWLHRAVRTTIALGHDVGATPGWAVGSFFVPFVNLVRPYNIVKAMADLLGGQAKAAPVGLWWTLWIVGNILSNFSSRMKGFNALDILAAFLSAGAAATCVLVMRSIQCELDARRSALETEPLDVPAEAPRATGT